MNKDLLKYPMVVEVDKGGAVTFYNSRTVEDKVAAVITELGADATPPRPYCHNCFDYECDTDEQLREHEKVCDAIVRIPDGKCVACGRPTAPGLLFYCADDQGKGAG
jgi:hypothetical protein